jgi:hypothetical protein
MENNKSMWLAAFGLAGFIHIIGQVIDQPMLVTCTKPLLMPLLAVWFYYQTIGHHPFLRKAILSGLGFATLGDLLLMFTGRAGGEVFFLGGFFDDPPFLHRRLFFAQKLQKRDCGQKPIVDIAFFDIPRRLSLVALARVVRFNALAGCHLCRRDYGHGLKRAEYVGV